MLTFHVRLINKGKLTLKQKLFCQYYLETFGNSTEASIMAGYSENVMHGPREPNMT